MKKILVIADTGATSIAVEFLKQSYDVTVVTSICSVQFVKNIKSYDLIISEIIMPGNTKYSPEEIFNGFLTGIIFYKKELQKLDIPTLFWSINDNLRTEVLEVKEKNPKLRIGFTQKFVCRDFEGKIKNEDHLLIAVNNFLSNYNLWQ